MYIPERLLIALASLTIVIKISRTATSKNTTIILHLNLHPFNSVYLVYHYLNTILFLHIDFHCISIPIITKSNLCDSRLDYHNSTGRKPMAPKPMCFQRAFLVLYGDYATPISAESDSATGEPTGTRTPISTLKGWCPRPVRRWDHINLAIPLALPNLH